MNILIIEDEIKTADELSRIINKIRPEIKISAKLQSISESLEWLSANEMPDLIFSDIQLSDGASFTIFKYFNKVPVIFCTAYDQFALQAFEYCGLDYLLKPVDEKILEKSFKKFERLKPNYSKDIFINVQQFEKLLIQQFKKQYQITLLSYFREQIIPIEVSDINYIYTENKLVYAYCHNRKYELKETLDTLINKLDPQFFFRANRQYIINRNAILNIEVLNRRKLLVNFVNKPDINVIISKEKLTPFFKWLEGETNINVFS